MIYTSNMEINFFNLLIRIGIYLLTNECMCRMYRVRACVECRRIAFIQEMNLLRERGE